MKKNFAILLCIMMLLTTLLTGCDVKTKGQVEQGDSSQSGVETENREPIPLTMVALSSLETEANVVRDQLKKAGFDVTLNILPDYGSLYGQVDARNYDINMGTFKNLAGNPDYSVRNIFMSDGDSNDSVVKNEEIDRLIDLAATQLPEESLSTYAQLEKLLVEDNAYFVPVCRMMGAFAFNKELLNPNSVEIGKSKYLYWTELDYNDPMLRDTKPLELSFNRAIGHLDPATQNGTFRVLSNTNIKLLELTNNDELTTEGTLSLNYAIAEGNTEYYFVLRDDVNFSTAVGKRAVDTGIRVGAEDVLFSLDRIRDKDAVPGHKAYGTYSIIESIDRVTDLSELESIKKSGSDITVKEVLNEGLEVSIKELMDNKESVNNGEGKYEVVKITTKQAFPQILNSLCMYTSGILCKDKVESMNDFDVATFDPNKDTRYGDIKFIKEGKDYIDEYLYCSGPYTVLYLNDYELVAERNPGFMPGTDSTGKIKTIVIKLISDPDAAISALRSGEINLAEDVSSNLIKVVEEDSKLKLKKDLVNGVVNLMYNLDDNKVTSNIDIRKAILYAINQDEIVAVKDGMGGKAYTTLTMLETGNEHNADQTKVKEHLDNYYSSLEK